MKKPMYFIQLTVSVLGFLLFSLFSGIVGSYVIENKNTPDTLDKIAFSFEISSYPYIASAFLLWVVILNFIYFKKRKR